MSETPRLDALEQSVRELAREVERLRVELRELRGSDIEAGTQPPRERATRGAPTAPAATPRVAPIAPRSHGRPVASPPRWQSIGLETLIGRYGALALAALAILLGVGVFLSWAVEHIRLGPEARVLLGVLVAAGIAALGAWIRGRGAQRFGNVLFGLALAIAHVVAWGAGPYLQVVPPWFALVAAAAASAALAALAWREDEEALFAVGLGGALISPFVTSAGESAVVPLLAFGTLVIASAMLAVGDRPWRVATRLIMAGFGLYAGAALAMPGGALGNLGDAMARAAPASFALAGAWLAILVAGERHRLPLGRAALAVGVIALLTAGLARHDVLHVELVVVALAITITAYALVFRAGPDLRVAILLPLGSLIAALTAIPSIESPLGALLAAIWSAVAALASLLDRTAGEAGAVGDYALPRVGQHFVAVLAAGAAVFLLFHETAITSVVALAAVAAIAAVLAHRVEPSGLVAGAVIVLLVATASSAVLLLERDWYDYAPFVSRESLASAAVVAAWWAWSRAASQGSGTYGSPAAHTAVRLLAPIVTFGWGYAELMRAFSREIATFLIILYLAAAGVTAILLGRARSLSTARHAGLALSIIAGLRALVQASELGFGLRLATYLVVGAFLLGVAYLYRATSEPAGDGSDAIPVTRP